MSEKSYSGTYLILSLKWSDTADRLLWWGPDNNGYTSDIDAAGRYTAEQIEANPGYYDNEESTRAVKVYDVMEGLVGPVRRIVDATFRYPVDHLTCAHCGEDVTVRKKYRSSATTCYNCSKVICKTCDYIEVECGRSATEEVGA